MSVIGYAKAADNLITLVGDEALVDDGVVTWKLWILRDALIDGQMSDDANEYSVCTKGIYLIGADGFIQYPPVVKVIELGSF
jgi:hypothetical protein